MIRAAGAATCRCCSSCSASWPSTSTCEHELRATEEQLREALFGERPAAEALIAELGWRAGRLRPVLPDLLELPGEPGRVARGPVRAPAHRGAGVGRALLAAVAARTRERGGERLEWAALDWNELALGFYRGLGARTMGEWITHRLTASALRQPRPASVAVGPHGDGAPVAFAAGPAVASGRALVVQWIRRPPPKR